MADAELKPVRSFRSLTLAAQSGEGKKHSQVSREQGDVGEQACGPGLLPCVGGWDAEPFGPGTWIPHASTGPRACGHHVRTPRRFGHGPAKFPQGIRVSRFHHTISSCGVHITGAGKPSSAQTPLSFSTMVALALWRQFQVRRKSIPWTAAIATWAASVSALAGINRLANKALVRASASGGYGNIRHAPSFARRSFAAVGSPRSTSVTTSTETNNS